MKPIKAILKSLFSFRRKKVEVGAETVPTAPSVETAEATPIDPLAFDEIPEMPSVSEEELVINLIPVQQFLEQGHLTPETKTIDPTTLKITKTLYHIKLDDGTVIPPTEFSKTPCLCSCGKWVKASTTKTCPDTGYAICPSCWRKKGSEYLSKKAARRRLIKAFLSAG
jgi:hypothetical protein